MFIKTNWIRPTFNVIWLIEILKLPIRIASNEILRVKAPSIAKNPKYQVDGLQTFR